jgi:elongation factor Ts
MFSHNLLEKVKKLREITGVGFKDCKNVIDETNGDIEKSIELLRKKGIAKASMRMDRKAAEGLICIKEKNNSYSIVEINSETDFVAKNNEFIDFVEEISEITLDKFGILKDILASKMKNNKSVNDNLVSLISKTGEKINFRRSSYIESKDCFNFSYVHSSLKKNVGKLGVLLSLETAKNKNEVEDLGKKLTMQIAASSPLSVDKIDLDRNTLEKEKEIITEALKNSGKDVKIIDKIAEGKFNKFINENTLMNQEWILEPKRKVKDVIKEVAGKDKIVIKKFIRFKVGEGI